MNTRLCRFAVASISLLFLLGCASAVRYGAPGDPKSFAIKPDPELMAIASRNVGSVQIRLERLTLLFSDFAYHLYCAEMERQGWFDHPVPQGEDPAQAAAAAERDRRARASAKPLGYVPQMSAGAHLVSTDPADVAKLFGPDQHGDIEQARYNPSFYPRAPGTVNCMCYSRGRQAVLWMCPDNPYQPKAKEHPNG